MMYQATYFVDGFPVNRGLARVQYTLSGFVWCISVASLSPVAIGGQDLQPCPFGYQPAASDNTLKMPSHLPNTLGTSTTYIHTYMHVY